LQQDTALKYTLRIGLLAVNLMATAAPPALAAAPLYHLVKTVPLGGPTKWDYLHFDAASHRVFIAHGTEVTVIDTKTDRIIGELAGTIGAHGIAVDPATGDIYADSAERRLAIAFDPTSFKQVAAVPTVLDADGMAYDPASKQVFVTGGDGDAITPINPATHQASPDIALGGSPEFLAADGEGSLYDNITDLSQIVRIDTASDKIAARWPLGACMGPKGLAVDPAKRLLFASCASGVMAVVNADTGAIIATLPIGKGTDAAAFDPVRDRAFAAAGDGTITVISDSGPTPIMLGTVKTALGARTMALDPANGDLYTVTARVTKITPPATPDDHPHFTFAPGSLKLLIYAPGG